MFANVYLARKSDNNFSGEKMAVGGGMKANSEEGARQDGTCW